MYSKKIPVLLVMNELVFKCQKTMDMYKGYAFPNLKFGLYTKFLQSAWKNMNILQIEVACGKIKP
jgi:hypothetical protein